MRPLFLIATFAVCLASCDDSNKGEASERSVEEARSVGDFPPKNLIRSEKVFPESVLVRWGYQTTGFADGSHAIRSKKNYGDSEEAFYARFHLAKAQFPSEDEAEREKRRIEALLESEAGFKNYTQLIRHGNRLYSFSPSGNRVFLDHQPELLEYVSAYLNSPGAESGGADRPATVPKSDLENGGKLDPESNGGSR